MAAGPVINDDLFAERNASRQYVPCAYAMLFADRSNARRSLMQIRNAPIPGRDNHDVRIFSKYVARFRISVTANIHAKPFKLADPLHR